MCAVYRWFYFTFGTRICKYNRNHGIFAQRRSYPTPIRVAFLGHNRHQMKWIWRGHWPCTTYENNLCNGFRIILANRPHITKLWLVCFLSYQHYTINAYAHSRTKNRPITARKTDGRWKFVCLNPDFYFASVWRITRISFVCCWWRIIRKARNMRWVGLKTHITISI